MNCQKCGFSLRNNRVQTMWRGNEPACLLLRLECPQCGYAHLLDINEKLFFGVPNDAFVLSRHTADGEP